jgi:hypothetical protein
VDVTGVHARIEFDCAKRVARAESTMRFTSQDVPAVFDIRQQVEAALLDGEPLDTEKLRPDAEGVRVINVPLEPGDHELALTYPVGTPACADAMPLGWTLQRPGIMFDFWMSDLHPGRYLEMWVPAPMCGDRFALTLELVVEGAGAHRAFSNGEVKETASGMTITYPETFTSLSPMLVLVPEGRYDLMSSVEDGISIETFKLSGPEIDLASCHVTVAECIAANRLRFGEYCHGNRFLSYVWGSTRGMEYDGATTASVGALEHEVFHSWFGRGVKPATASDGWIDEAITTWYTSGPPRPRQWAQPFDWSEPPVLLYPPNPFARYTPREAYGQGARLFAGVADLIGVDGLIDAMASLYRERAGAFIATDELQAHLSKAAGTDLEPVFERWVHGHDVSR